MNGIMNLVLDFLEKLNGDITIWDIINTGRVDFKHLSVNHLFRSTYIADTLQQFLEGTATAKIFQALNIQSKALSHILLQKPCCPNTKLNTVLRFHTVADKKDNIKIIIIDIIHFSIGGSIGKFCPYCYLLKLSFFENVSQELTYTVLSTILTYLSYERLKRTTFSTNSPAGNRSTGCIPLTL